MFKQYVDDIKNSWLRKTICIKIQRYILAIVAIVIIGLVFGCYDSDVLVGVLTGVAATFAVKVCDCNYDMHMVFRRTKRIVEDFIWNYENAISVGTLNDEARHILSNLRSDMLLEATMLCPNDNYNNLSKNMLFACTTLSEETLKIIKDKYNILFNNG